MPSPWWNSCGLVPPSFHWSNARRDVGFCPPCDPSNRPALLMNPRQCHRACSCLKENRGVLKHGQVAAETDVLFHQKLYDIVRCFRFLGGLVGKEYMLKAYFFISVYSNASQWWSSKITNDENVQYTPPPVKYPSMMLSNRKLPWNFIKLKRCTVPMQKHHFGPSSTSF